MKPPNDLPTDQNDPRFQEWFQEAQQKSVGEPPATIVQDLTDLWSNDWFMRFHFFSRWERSDQHSLFEEFSAGRFISEGMNEKQGPQEEADDKSAGVREAASCHLNKYEGI